MAPFTMKGVDHRLRLIPAARGPRLIMESAPDDFSDKVDNEIVEQRAEHDADEVAALEALKTQGEQVVDSAHDRDFGEVPNVEVPEVQQLGNEVHTFADQFDETDLNDGLPPEAVAPYDPTGPEPPSTVQRIPWDDFVALVDSTTDPMEALQLVEREEAYLNQELRDVDDWLNGYTGSRGSAGMAGSPARSTAERRRTEILSHLSWCIHRKRALRTQMNPNHRVALPCFPAGTLVHTPSGIRPIESLRVGDDVWSADPETGTVVASQVEGVLINQAIELIVVHAKDQEMLRATPHHPCWDDGTRQWIPAKEIASGTSLRMRHERVQVTRVERRSIAAATTYNLALGPLPTFFVGAGVLVHNGSYALWHTYPWSSPHNFKIYIGLNDDDEFKDYVYVGQTSQTISAREAGHIGEAARRLREGGLSPEDEFFFRFKRGMRLTAICEGLKGEDSRHSNQAKYLEQVNINEERNERGLQYVLNRIEVTTDLNAIRDRILADADVQAAGYCL